MVFSTRTVGPVLMQVLANADVAGYDGQVCHVCVHFLLQGATVLDNQTQQKNMNDLFLFKMHRKYIFIFSQNIKLATPKI